MSCQNISCTVIPVQTVCITIQTVNVQLRASRIFTRKMSQQLLILLTAFGRDYYQKDATKLSALFLFCYSDNKNQTNHQGNTIQTPC